MDLRLAPVWHDAKGLTFGFVMRAKAIAVWAAMETALCLEVCANPFWHRSPFMGQMPVAGYTVPLLDALGNML